MKTIAQLIDLSTNPYYKFTDEEQAALDAFLSQKSAPKTYQKDNGNDSEKNIPATVINKNIVKKEIGEIPTLDNVVEDEDKQ